MSEELMHKRLRRTTVIVVIISVVLIVTGILVAIYLSNAMKTAAFEQISAETNEYNKRIHDQIDTDYQIINTFSSIVGESGLMDNPDFPEMLDNANNQNDFLTMIYMDSDGTGVAATLEKGVTENISLSELQPEVQNVLEAALEGQYSMSSLIYGQISNEAVFVYGTPVYQGSDIAGALAFSDKVEIFEEILNGDGVLGGYGYINMINEGGDFIVHSENDTIGKDLDNIFSEPYFTESEAEAAKDALEKDGELKFSFSYGRDSYEAVIQEVGINNWYLFSVSDVEISGKQVYLIGRIIGSVFGAIMILTLFLLIYGRRLMKRNSHELKNIAYHDPLTSAYNFTGFRKTVEKRIASDRNYSIISLNVHQFKFINEIFGKDMADKLLYRISECIKDNSLREDIVGRESGDKFYVYTAETDAEKLTRRLKKIMGDITDKSVEGYGDYEILMYCGVAVAAEDGQKDTLDEMMTHIMLALDCAKKIHQNNIWFFDKELHIKEVMDNYVETHMNQALKDEEFRLFLQPQVLLEREKVTSAEALVRWIKSDGEMVCPNQFIPLFEANGFCVQLDLYMVNIVCRQIRAWMDQGLEPVHVSINQSKRVIYEKDYIALLTEIVDRYQVPSNLITIEILEGLALENAGEINRKIEELQRRGFQVSLDDFGSEYSSLNTLSKLRIDELKLDRWFLQAVTSPNSEKVRLIMEKVIEIAHKLRISMVVEGVETEEDHELIKTLKCDYGQGFYYSRPVSAKEFTDKYLVKK